MLTSRYYAIIGFLLPLGTARENTTELPSLTSDTRAITDTIPVRRTVMTASEDQMQDAFKVN